MTAKRKLAMSGVAIITVLTLVAGATMAWFTDTEKVNANFEAGVLDITAGNEAETDLNFKNLRPMADKEAYLAEVNAVLDDENYYDGKGYAPTPVYVQEFAINNEGTLPVNLKLKVEDNDPTDDHLVPNIVSNEQGGVRVGKPEKIPCDNELGKKYDVDADEYSEVANNEHFHFVLLQKSEDGKDWIEVQELSIDKLKEGYTLLDENGEELVLPAGESVENSYALGAYLDSETGNNYQGKEYHVTMKVLASQTDEGATYAE